LNERIPELDKADFYRDYPSFKQWAAEEVIDDVDRFSRTLGKLKLHPTATILEIGFGEGRFLDWAKHHGYQVEGIEIIPEMVAHASARGHLVYLGSLTQLESAGRRFDLVAAFDVIEHLTLPEILHLIHCADQVLNQEGRILLQFPNASSPFSALYQNGDVTHQSALSKGSLEQLARTKGWVVAQVFNARVSSPHPFKQIKMLLSYMMRDAIEIIFSFAYYWTRCPLDPNIIVVLKRDTVANPKPISKSVTQCTGR
jgi:2-polyprenyl-3-methyl-5-hydroxy-6-metoxy-1,4-benzoquinol methylase